MLRVGIKLLLIKGLLTSTLGECLIFIIIAHKDVLL